MEENSTIGQFKLFRAVLGIRVLFFVYLVVFPVPHCFSQGESLISKVYRNLLASKFLVIDSKVDSSIENFKYQGLELKRLSSSARIEIKRGNPYFMSIHDIRRMDFKSEDYSPQIQDSWFYLVGNIFYFRLGQEWFKIDLGEDIWEVIEGYKDLPRAGFNNKLSRSFVDILKNSTNFDIFKRLKEFDIEKKGAFYIVFAKIDEGKNRAGSILKGIVPQGLKAGPKDGTAVQVKMYIGVNDMRLHKIVSSSALVLNLESAKALQKINLIQEYTYPESFEISLPSQLGSARDLTLKTDKEIEKIFLKGAQ